MNLSTKEKEEEEEEKEEKKYQQKLLKLAKKISKIPRLQGIYFYEPQNKNKQHQFYVAIGYFIPSIETDSAKYCYAFVTEELKKRGIYL